MSGTLAAFCIAFFLLLTQGTNQVEAAPSIERTAAGNSLKTASLSPSEDLRIAPPEGTRSSRTSSSKTFAGPIKVNNLACLESLLYIAGLGVEGVGVFVGALMLLPLLKPLSVLARLLVITKAALPVAAGLVAPIALPAILSLSANIHFLK
ncbi:MAG: hypothetical protein K2X27_24150 [Candidatus Obscuribacterales bacterium]|nr:hypothetical protein [Candidatus Obscuribacterales bacterium]